MVFLLLACSSESTACRDGTLLAEDGHCYPPVLDQSPQIADVFAGLPPCEPALGPGTIDLVGGCGHGVCAGMTYEEVAEVVGDVECVTTTFDSRQVYCTWDDWGLDVRFADQDQDDVPDHDATTERVHLFRPSTAATDEGVGVDASLACFVEALGDPDRIEFVDAGGQMRADSMNYDRYGMTALDRSGPGGVSRPDGFIDDLYLFGL